jgi:hypothetical protein
MRVSFLFSLFLFEEEKQLWISNPAGYGGSRLPGYD